MGNLLAASMPLIIDIVGIVFILIFAVRGMREGFGQIIFSTFGTIVCLILSVVLCSYLTTFLGEKFGLIAMVADKLDGPLTKVFGENVMNTSLEGLAEGGLTAAKLQELKITGILNKVVLAVVKGTEISDTMLLGDVLCMAFAYYVVLICSAIVLFIVFKILLKIISATTEKLRSLVLVAAVDELLGFVLGLISGVIYMELVIMLIGVLPIPAIQSVSAAIAQTKVVSLIHNIGIIQLILNFITSDAVKSFISNIPNK